MVSKSAPIINYNYQRSEIQIQMNTHKHARNNPADFIKQLLGRPVEVKLNDNETSYRGTLCCLDGTMNVLLTNAK